MAGIRWGFGCGCCASPCTFGPQDLQVSVSACGGDTAASFSIRVYGPGSGGPDIYVGSITPSAALTFSGLATGTYYAEVTAYPASYTPTGSSTGTVEVVCKGSSFDFPASIGIGFSPAAGHCCSIFPYGPYSVQLGGSRTLSWRGGSVTLNWYSSYAPLGLTNVWLGIQSGVSLLNGVGSYPTCPTTTLAPSGTTGGILFYLGPCSGQANEGLFAVAAVCSAYNAGYPAESYVESPTYPQGLEVVANGGGTSGTASPFVENGLFGRGLLGAATTAYRAFFGTDEGGTGPDYQYTLTS